MKIFLKQKHLSGKWTYQYLTKVFAISLLLLFGQVSFAQNISTKSRFSVDHIQGCAPLTVNLTDLGSVIDNGAPILVHFNRDPLDPENPTGISNPMNTGGSLDTTYTTPGTYLIGQVNGNIADQTDLFDFIQIVVTEALAPTYSVTTCTNNNILIDIDFSADTYDGYLIDFGDGQSLTITKSDPSIVNYSYAVQNNYNITITGQLNGGTSVSCGSATTPITTIVNLPLPQISELSVQSNTSALLSYSTLEQYISYQLEVDSGNGFTNLGAISALADPNSLLIDDPIFDFENNLYTFRIMATEACGNSSGFSNAIPSVALTYSALYVGNEIEITFDWSTTATDLTELFLFRNGTIDGTSNNAQGQQVINLSNCSNPLSFQIEANFSGTTSQSLLQIPDLLGTLTPPPLATPEIVFSGGDLLVRWTPPMIPISVYNVYRQDSDGNYLQIGTSTGTQYLDSGLNASTRQICYRVSYVDECGNESELSTEVCEDLSNQILIPNAFTPNGDGVNDVFIVAEGVYRNFSFYIYNRWGGLVFGTTNSAIGWDGKVNGQLSPAGTYIYRVQYFDVDDRLTSLSGTFLLIR